MALTQTDLDALDLAIASGVLTCEMDGQRLTYQSTDAMIRARRHVASIIANNQNTGSRAPGYSIGIVERF